MRQQAVGPRAPYAPVLAAIGAAGICAWLAAVSWRGSHLASVWLVGVVLALVIKPGAAALHRGIAARRASAAAPSGRVVIVVPFHDEDPDLLTRCLTSVITQTRRADVLVVVDDGSAPDAAVRRSITEAERMARAAGIAWCRIRFEEQCGKRAAIVAAVRSVTDCEWYVLVDSDTILEPSAVDQVLRPLSDDGVGAVTGHVRALNWDINLLTRLIDLRYTAAFLGERAAYSVTGSVLCLCGSLSAHRGDLLRRNLTAFAEQRFLGRPCTFGDDRHLTNLVLYRGRRVVLAPGAVAHTHVPERLGHFSRQQVRWSKSFFRESLWAIRYLPLRTPAMWLSVAELTSWLALTGVLVWSLLVGPYGKDLRLAAFAVLGAAILAWCRSVWYLDAHRDRQSTLSRWRVFSLAPLYGVLHVVLLLPLRCFALFRLTDPSWGTRLDGVERRAHTAR